MDRGDVVGVVSGNDVAALQHQANHGASSGLLRQISAACVPIQILLEVFKHRWSQWMPDPEIWENLRFRHLHRWALFTFNGGEDVFIRQHQEKIPKIVRSSSKPVLKTEHETARILRFFHWQVFENRGKRVQQLEHRVLKTSATGLLPLFHETGNRTFALAKLRHREAAELVQPHHLWHRGEYNGRLQTIAVGCNGFHHLLSQILNKDQRGNKNVRLSDIGTKTGVIVVVAQLFY